MAGERDRTRWRAEFEALGSAKVRSEMMLNRYQSDKRAYARQWLDRKDVEEWQARAPSGTSSLSKFRFRRGGLWGTLGGLIFGGFLVFRLLRQFKIGF